MVDIECYFSGSGGNLYRVGSLLIDLGVPLRKIQEALDFGLSKIEACLVTHSHLDHAKGAKDLMLKAGLDVYCTEGTAKELNLFGHRLHLIKAMQKVEIGEYLILPFEAVHDAPESVSFLIAHGEEKVVFATDTMYIPFRFKGLTHIMIEAGYSAELMKENILSGAVDPQVGKRTLLNHMSIEAAMGFLKANDLSGVKEVHLLHLSDNNSDSHGFKERVEKETGIPCYIAG